MTDKRARTTMLGLCFLRDTAIAEGNLVAAQEFTALIAALETGGEHPLLSQWEEKVRRAAVRP